jgi:hypothetical protein
MLSAAYGFNADKPQPDPSLIVGSCASPLCVQGTVHGVKVPVVHDVAVSNSCDAT